MLSYKCLKCTVRSGNLCHHVIMATVHKALPFLPLSHHSGSRVMTMIMFCIYSRALIRVVFLMQVSLLILLSCAEARVNQDLTLML